MDISNPKDIMTILKIASLILGSISTVWALTRKTTYDDANGNKKLNSSGVVAIVLIGGSLIVGVTTLGFEALVRQQEDSSKAQAALQALSDRRQAAAEQAARDAYARSAVTNARLLALQLADAGRIRDLQIATEANTALSLNLARSNRILTQVDRSLNPLENLVVNVALTYPGPLNVSDELRQRIAAAAATHDDFDRQINMANSIGQYSVHQYGGITRVRGRGLLYPTRENSFELSVVAATGFTVSIFHSDTADVISRELRGPTDAMSAENISRYADYGFQISPENTEVQYELPAGGFESFFSSRPAETSITKTGRIVAVSDFENSMLIAVPSMFFGDAERHVRQRIELDSLNIRISGKDYRFGRHQIQRYILENGEPIFVIRRIGGES